MFSEPEWSVIEPLLRLMTGQLQKHRESTGASLEAALMRGYEWPVLAKHKKLTGREAVDVHCLWHHRLSDYGPTCASCGELLKTSDAKKCYNCGTLVA